MLKRQYFRRLWVAQEIYMAEQPLLYCGPSCCRLTALEGLLAVSRHDDTEGAGDLKWAIPRGPISDRLLLASIRACRPQPYQDLLDLTSQVAILRLARIRSDQKLGLENVLADTETLDCADPRDKVYAVLSTLDDEVAETITVDYSQTAFELAMQLFVARSGYFGPQMLYYGNKAQEARDGWHNAAQMLQLHPYDSAFIDAVTARITSKATTGSSPTVSQAKQTSVLISGWEGHQVFEVDSEWFLSGTEAVANAPVVRHARYIDYGLSKGSSVGSANVMLSADVRSGDWIVQAGSFGQQSSGACPALVLRDTEGRHLPIVGTALTSTHPDANYPRSKGTFAIDLGTEDYATMMWLLPAFFAYESPLLQIQSARSSGIEHASVQGLTVLDTNGTPLSLAHQGQIQLPPVDPDRSKWPSPFETRSLSVIEQYFCVRVCGAHGSSYAYRPDWIRPSSPWNRRSPASQ